VLVASLLILGYDVTALPNGLCPFVCLPLCMYVCMLVTSLRLTAHHSPGLCFVLRQRHWRNFNGLHQRGR